MEEYMSTTIMHVDEDIGAEDMASTTAEACPSIGDADAEAPAGERSSAAREGIDRFEQQELKAILEALLFISSEPLPLPRMVALLGHASKAAVQEALDRLRDELEQEGRGLRLVEIAGGYRLVTRTEYAPWVKRLDKTKAAPKLSRSALESLAIIAYKQPIVRAELESIRGVETSGVLRTLLERKLIRIVGRQEVPGRPIMYGTTKFFLEHFGLKDLSSLPPLREFKELGESEQAYLPIEEDEQQDESLASCPPESPVEEETTELAAG
jgi:segregation and condensation protein B